jgi:hypothetical protein
VGIVAKVSPGLLLALAVTVTVVAAARSTWSPCGLSMLSTVTPLGERSRGHRYPVTVAWFVAGAVAGGATLGAIAAIPAALAGALDPGDTAVGWVVAGAAAITAASDLRLGGFHLPSHPRQVDEVWLGRYRHWVYGAGFGWQIGVGLATYVMTAAVYLVLALAALTGRPVVALLLGTGFGLVRGLAVLLGVRLTTPEALRALHRRIESLAAASLFVAVVAQTVVVVVAVATVAPRPVSVVVAIVVAAGLAFLGRPVAEHVGVGRGLRDEVGDELAELAGRPRPGALDVRAVDPALLDRDPAAEDREHPAGHRA